MSVLMLARNADRYVGEAVASVLAQSYRDFELVVVDDASTDRTRQVLDGFPDPRLKVVTGPGQGIVAAANLGLDVLVGEYVARLDADDVMVADRLARQVAYLDRHPGVVACGTDYELFGARSGVVRMPRTARACRARLLFGNCIANPSVMFRAWPVRTHGLRYRPEFPYAEDYQLVSELSELGELVNLDFVGLRYRVHPGQTSIVNADAQREQARQISAANLCRRGLTPDWAQQAADVASSFTHAAPPTRTALGELAGSAVTLLPAGARAHGPAGVGTVVRLLRERVNTAVRTGPARPQAETDDAGTDGPALAVVICAYSAARSTAIEHAVATVQEQLDPERDELIVVVDHNDALLARLQQNLSASPRLQVVASTGPAGLSGARNSGVARSTAPVVVFLDDDAVPQAGWVTAWRRVFTDEAVAVAGGAVRARWAGGAAPRWFPDEYGWVVGCDYRGLPPDGSVVRNPIGANMAARRTALARVGGFSSELGRAGLQPAGCEETELGIRVGAAYGAGSIIRTTGPAVDHHVSADRRRLRYFVRRCYHEGRSKAVLAGRVGAERSLASERRYVVRSLLTGLARHGGAALRGDLAGLARGAALLLGLLATTAGYLLGGRTAARPSPVPATRTDVRSTGTGRAEPVDPSPGSQEAAVPVVDVELTTPLPAIDTPASLLVRLHGLPVGSLWLEPGRDAAEAIATELQAPLRHRLTAPDTLQGGDLLTAARRSPAPTPLCSTTPVTVVLCTLGLEPRLRTAVQAVLAQTHTALELVVVDNDPAGGRTRALLRSITDPRLRIVPAPLRGLSAARNRGLSEATTPLIAFTDDDALPDPRWIEQLVAVFDADSEQRVGAVTGLVTPAGLDTRWERLFEEYGAFDKGYLPQVWSVAPLPAEPGVEPGRRGPLFPYGGGDYGSGNNMAFRTGLLRRIGGFDLALGAGVFTRGGEDLDIFSAVLCAGAAIRYTPTALVRHHHRDTEAALTQQLYGYGTGMAAAVTKQLVGSPAAAFAVVRAFPAALRVLLSPSSPKNEGKSAQFPVELTRAELRGYLAGPWLLWRSRRRARRARRGRVP